MAKRTKQIGGLSFGSDEAYENFLSLPKQEQVKQVAASYSPQDEARAIEALKGVRNGDSSATTTETEENNVTDATGSNGTDNTTESGSTNGAESKGAKKR